MQFPQSHRSVRGLAPPHRRARSIPKPPLRSPPASSCPHADEPASDDDAAPVEWSEDAIVRLHWRLLQELRRLRDPAAPLEDKLDTLRWVFTEPEKDRAPFSFANCLRVVGVSPLSPIEWCGLVDVEEVRDRIRCRARSWLDATLARYPAWVRRAVVENPGWIESKLERNPQWINEQIRQMSAQGDFFA